MRLRSVSIGALLLHIPIPVALADAAGCVTLAPRPLSRARYFVAGVTLAVVAMLANRVTANWLIARIYINGR